MSKTLNDGAPIGGGQKYTRADPLHEFSAYLSVLAGVSPSPNQSISQQHCRNVNVNASAAYALPYHFARRNRHGARRLTANHNPIPLLCARQTALRPHCSATFTGGGGARESCSQQGRKRYIYINETVCDLDRWTAVLEEPARCGEEGYHVTGRLGFGLGRQARREEKRGTARHGTKPPRSHRSRRHAWATRLRG